MSQLNQHYKLKKERSTHCSLCAEFSGESGLHASLLSDVPSRRILYRDSTAAVIPSIGALRAGHVLFCPIDHYLSMAAFAADQGDTATAFAGEIARELSQLYRSPIMFFEHGTCASDHMSSACIEHAHLHLVPSVLGADSSMLDDFDDWQPIFGLEFLQSMVGTSSYMLVGAFDNGFSGFVRRVTERVPPQYLRWRFASSSGMKLDWNWRTNGQRSNFLATIKDWSRILIATER